MMSPASILLRLSDLPEAECQGAALPLTARDAALLAWLAVEGPTSRDRLCALLWPDSTPDQARTTLRQRLFRLRKALGRDLARGSPILQLAPGVEHDLGEATELLGDLNVPEAPELDAWLQRQRGQRRAQEQAGLRAQADALEAAGACEAALQVAQTLLRLDPLSEPAFQRVMRLHYLRGDRAAALAAFDACERMLKHELGARPSPATLALLDTLERAQAPARVFPLPLAVLKPPRRVGRDAEFMRLQQAWARSAPALLEGEAGIGKSRLLADLVASLGVEQQAAIVVSARPGDLHVPLALMGRLLRLLLDCLPAQPSAADSTELGRVLPDYTEPPALEPGARPTRLLGTIATLIERACSAGLRAIVIDDLHCADGPSLDLLASLVGGPAPRWALAWRAAELGAAGQALVDAWCEQLHADRIVLQPLDHAGIVELLGSLRLGDMDLDATAVALRRHTGGNPMFLLETLKAQLAMEHPDWVHPPAVENVRQLIQRRLGRLSAPAQRLARLAAVAGRDFSAELAVQLLQCPPLDLADAWNELEQAQVLQDGRFAHDLVFEAARASVPEPLARHLHADIARRLAETDAPPASIAEHAFAGGVWAIAAPACERAGQRARRDGHAATAQRFFQRAATARARLGDEPGRFEALCSAAESSTHRALDAETERQLDELAALAEGEAQQLAVDMLRLEFQGRKGDKAEAVATGLRALALARRLGHFEWALQAATVIALVQDGEPEPATAQHLREAAEWIQTQDFEGLELEKHYGLGAIQRTVGDLALAAQAYEAAARAALAQARHESASSVLINAAAVMSAAGCPERALALGQQSLAVIAEADEAQRPVDLGHKKLLIAAYLRDAGHYAEAVAEFERLLPWFAGQQDTMRERQCRWRLAMCFAHLGQFARTGALLADDGASLSDNLRGNHVRTLIEIQHLSGGPLAPFAEVALAQPLAAMAPEQRHGVALTRVLVLPPVESLPLLAEAEGYFRQRGLRGDQALALARMARALRQTGNVAAAAEVALRAAALAAHHAPNGIYRGIVWLEAAQALHAAGNAEAANATVQAATDWLQQVLPHVPPEFRASFLERNVVNRQLLAWSCAGQATDPAAA